MKKYKIFFNSFIEQLKNGKYPKRYRSEHIEPGICSYEDLGMGIIYIGSEALDKMNETFIGKPIVNELHQDFTPEQAFKLSNEDLESMADGVVYEVGRLDNGWYFNDFIVWDLETQKNIDKNGYNVSCAYIVDEVGPKGKYHEIDYDEEVVNGTYTHHAIVSKPRYERAKVYELPSTYKNNKADEVTKLVKNSKGEKDMSKIFKYLFNTASEKNKEKNPKKLKNQDEEEIKRKEKEVDDDKMINMEGAYIEVDGQKIPLEEAVNAYKSSNANIEDEPKLINADDEIEVDGQKVKGSDLIAAYQAMKENAESAQDVKAEEVVEEQQTVKNIGKEKKDYFKIVKNAVSQNEPEKILLNTRQDRLKRGKHRYGKIKEEE